MDNATELEFIETIQSNVSEDFDILNITDFTTESENEVSMFLIPQSVLIGYMVLLVIGGILNLFVIFALITKKRNGTLSLILQLSISDLGSLIAVGLTEVYSINRQSWTFGSDLCPVFLAAEVFTGTATVYILVVINLHAIVTSNLIINYERKKLDSEENNDEIGDTESSQHSLVARNSSSIPSRSVNIDYRRKKTTISVILPMMFVWFLAASLSIPELALSTTVETIDEVFLCTIIDVKDRTLLQLLLATFRFIIPMTLFIISIIALVFKMCAFRKENNSLLIKNIKELLNMSLSLTLIYVVISMPKLITIVMHMFPEVNEVKGFGVYKMPPLHYHAFKPIFTLGITMLYYIPPTIRPVLCYMCNSEIRNTVQSTYWNCKSKEENAD